MSRAAASRLGVALVASTAILAIGGPLLPGSAGDASPVAEDVMWAILWLTFAGLGALIVSRRPDVSLGWLFCLFPLAMQGWVAAGDYAVHGLLERPGSLPAADAAAWLTAVLLAPVLVVAALLLLLFPSGHAATPGTQRLVRAVVANGAVLFAARAITPGSIMQGSPLRNPLGVEALGPVVEPLVTATTTVAILLLIGAVGFVFVRRRGAQDVERRQLDWFAFAAAVLATAWILGAVMQEAGLNDGAGIALIYVAGILSLPIAMAVAILRYRLYDLGRIVNRTLVYGVLTLTLGAAYLGLVLLVGLALGESDLAIAGSTLAVAALFRPARARIQSLVDRRFYRRRYDAEQTLEAFSGRLRDELDLEAMSDELRVVVEQTMQPAHVTLWLRA